MPSPADATNQYHAGVMIAVRGAGRMSISSRSSASPSASPRPHSTSVIASAVGVQIKIIQFGCAGEPVGVDMDQVWLFRARSMYPGKHEGRRNDRAGAVQSMAKTLGQRGLTRAELSGGHDHITLLQHCGQSSAQPLHVLGGWHSIATGRVLVKITPCGTVRARPKPRWCQKAIKSASSSRA